MHYKVYEIPCNLLAEEWKEDNRGGICYAVSSGGSLGDHKSYCEDIKLKLLRENDEDYTSWVHTGTVYKPDQGIVWPHMSVLHFRVRDSY